MADLRPDLRAPGALPNDFGQPDPRGLHEGSLVSGTNGEDGPKAFYIHLEALPGKENEVLQMLQDILACVQDEPATGPWYGVRYSPTGFAIFEVFPDLEGRKAHVNGGGGDIFRDLERMNKILARPAHVARVDVLLSKQVFTAPELARPA